MSSTCDPTDACAVRWSKKANLRGHRRPPVLLLALNLVIATSTGMVIVNTVVLAHGILDRPQTHVALLLAAYGAGSMIVALALPRVLDRLPDRRVMLSGAAALPIALLLVAIALMLPPSAASWVLLIGLWFVLGTATSLILTPSSRLLRRASTDDTRSAVFAAQFSLSHASFIITYPMAGVLGALIGLPATALVLAALGVTAAIAARAAWTSRQPACIQE